MALLGFWRIKAFKLSLPAAEVPPVIWVLLGSVVGVGLLLLQAQTANSRSIDMYFMRQRYARGL
jgi:hypothetical protein